MKSILRDTRAESGASMIGVVIAGLVAIIVGVLIWYKLNTAIFESAAGAHGVTGHGTIGTLFNTTNTTANTVWTLFPIVAIVVVAGVILSIVMGFGRQQA